MNIKSFQALIIVITLNMTMVVQAHEQTKHTTTDNEKPNCDAMKSMDHSKMDMKDPVVQAMMKKCMNHDLDKHSSPSQSSTEENKHKKHH